MEKCNMIFLFVLFTVNFDAFYCGQTSYGDENLNIYVAGLTKTGLLATFNWGDVHRSFKTMSRLCEWSDS